MNKLLPIVALTLAVATSTTETFATEVEKWRDPTIFEINREPAHSEFTTYKSRTAALQPLNLENPWHSELYRSLNGEWEFNWYGVVGEVPEDWYLPQTSVTTWDSMPVPGVWQSKGYDRFYYVNPQMPFIYTENMVERRPEFLPETIDESKAKGFIPTDAQTVGCYRKWVEISNEELAESVILRIGAVEAGVELYINGVEVGYSQDSFLPAEFDIAEYLQEGRNLIAMKVYRWTDGSYMEVQDMIRWAGIYRDVYLKFNSAKSIRDIQFVGTPDSSLSKIDTRYEISVVNNSAKTWKRGEVKFELLELGETTPVRSWSREIAKVAAGAEITLKGDIELTEMKLWSPDAPNLYTLIATLQEGDEEVIEVARIDAGFKRFEEIDGNYHLNGKRFFIKGVNRHDHNAFTGHYVPLEDLIKDAELMKQNNINTVRTSHYPNDERWYYICNRYGIAILGEANVESHGFNDVPDSHPQWLDAAVARVTRMVHRDLNHPAILLWSLGNEQGQGWCKAFDLQYDAAKAIDPTRFVMCDRGVHVNKAFEKKNPTRLDKPDAVTPMYQAYNNAIKYLKNRETDRRPFFMCEYRHAMGNSVGSLKDVWDLYYENEDNGLNGGCIWDWVDQGVAAYDESGELYYQYGGDWDDVISLTNFCLNGLVLSDRGETPKLAEVKRCYEPFTVVAVDIEKGLFSVRNRLNQQSLDCYTASWELIKDGSVVEGGEITTLDAAPQASQQFTLPYDPSKMCDKSEYYVRIYFNLGEDTLWAKRGFEVTFAEFKVKGMFNYGYTPNSLTPTYKSLKDRVVVSTQSGVELTFNRKSGVLSSLKVKGQELLAETPREMLFDSSMAWIDNLRGGCKEYKALEVDKAKRVGDAKIRCTRSGNFAVVTIENLYMSEKDAGFRERQEWRIDGLGEILLTESVTPEGELTPETWVPRIGLRIPLKPTLNNMSYYGLGPFNNELDRQYSARTGLYHSKVAESYIAYPYPQDHGNRMDVRWISLSDNQGRGIKVIAPKMLAISALPYTQDELLEAKHTIELPDASTTTELRVAAKVTGIGNGSCGPLTDEIYRTTAEAVEYQLYIIPFSL